MTSLEVSLRRIYMGDSPRIRLGKSDVRRNLFGPVDHDQLKKDLKAEMEEMKRVQREQWNFDFERETPLPGRYLWKKVDSDCNISPYSCSVITKSPAPYENGTTDISDLCSNTCNDSRDRVIERGVRDPRNLETCASEGLVTHKRRENKKQKKITDFVKQKKRKTNCNLLTDKQITEDFTRKGDGNLTCLRNH